jgi:hypothetical protein
MKAYFRVLAVSAAAGFLLLCSCGVAVRESASGFRQVRYSSLFENGRRGRLTPVETEWAKIAWKYFQNNTDGATGLANSLDRNPGASAWTIGDYLAALNAAEELGVIKEGEFSDRVVRVVQFLNGMELFNRRLPNVYYNVQSGAMVNSANLPNEGGWSAIDLGRLLIWLRITRQRAPALAEYIDKAVLRWNFCDVVDSDGTLYAGYKRNDGTEVVREGRLGYGEYAALGFQAWGFDTRKAIEPESFGKAQIDKVEILYDSRDPRLGNTYNPVVTLPYALMGIEFNWESIGPGGKGRRDSSLAALAQSIYEVQEARFRTEHILTARSDHALGRAPNFVYDTIFVAGYPWNTITADGVFVPQEALVSTRAAFGMWALWKTGYTDTLLRTTRMLNDPSRGWFEGRFEATGGPETTLSSTTNAVVLEALLYLKTGKLFRTASEDGFYSLTLRSDFSGSKACLPQRR